MLETASYFLWYVLPIILASFTVFIIAFFNYIMGPILWRERIAEQMEILAYSVLFIGPLVFAISFLIYFYGLKLLREEWLYAKVIFLSASILFIVVIIFDIIFLPKIK